MAKVTFRLIGDDHPLTWAVPQGGVMAVKVKDNHDYGKKFINYYPGQDSIYVEDIINKDIKPALVPLFTYNPLPTSKATELTFDDSDRNLFNYLTTHPWNGKKWRVFSKDMEAREKLGKYDSVEKALDCIRESDNVRVKANTIAVLGLHYFNKTDAECALALKDKAMNSPLEVIQAFNSPDYQTRFLASLAFCKGVVKNNLTSTAVVWNDGREGVIVHVAQGENGIDKLTDFLAKDSQDALTTLQEFQSRLDAADVNAGIVESDKDRKIRELEAQLAAMTTAKTGVATKPEGEMTEIEKLQAAYFARYGKEPGFAYKNNVEWLTKKLEAAEQAEA